MSWHADDRWTIGAVCTTNGNWYVVHRVGSRGACFGPCFYGEQAKNVEFRRLRALCDLVEPAHIPDKVVAALARFALTGEVTRLAT